MKKTILSVSLALIAGSAFAAPTAVTAADATTGILNAACAYIPASNTAGVKLTTSANVAAAYECTSTAVVTGAAHTQGKKHGYINSSAGGTQIEVQLTANPASTTDVGGFNSAAEWTTALGS